MTPTETFVWGAFGSVAVEVVSAVNSYHGRHAPPLQYRQAGFWVSRLVLVGIAGGLALATAVTAPLAAVYVGASAPLILQRFSRGLRDDLLALPTPSLASERGDGEPGARVREVTPPPAQPAAGAVARGPSSV